MFSGDQCCAGGGRRVASWVREQISWKTSVGMPVHVPPSWEGYGETALRTVPFQKWKCEQGFEDSLNLVAASVAYGYCGREVLEVF